jgi:hypothetical protein
MTRSCHDVFVRFSCHFEQGFPEGLDAAGSRIRIDQFGSFEDEDGIFNLCFFKF